MKQRLPHTGTSPSTLGYGRIQDTMPAGSRVWYEDQACCCPAQPVVRVIMPPTASRPHPVDLLLCGHHYRVSRQALAAVHARIECLPGKADAAEAALLESTHPDQADVM